MSMTLYRTSAFAYKNQGGNEAGVVFDTEHLNEASMLKIAAQVGYSETAFLFESDVADYKLRYFTPTTEVPICGHATIATFNLMRNLGHLSPKIVTVETKAGIFPVRIEASRVCLTLPNAIYEGHTHYETIAQYLELDQNELLEYPLDIVSTGIKALYIGFKTLTYLHSFNPAVSSLIALSKHLNIEGIYCYTLDTDDPTHDVQSRNFMPVLGIDEESATGTAAGAMASYLNRYILPHKTQFMIEQGYSMNKPSLIYASTEPFISVGGQMRFIDKIIGFSVDHDE